MLTYCLKCQKKKYKKCEFKSIKNKNEKNNLSSKCAICQSRKSRFMKEQEAKGLLSGSGIKTPQSNIALLGNIFF